MTGWAGLIGTFLPALVPMASCFGFFSGRRIWLISIAISLLTWFCFIYILFYIYSLDSDKIASVFSPIGFGSNTWSKELGLRWDFLAGILSLVASTVIICFHFVARANLERSRATIASVMAFLVCLLGSLGSSHLFMFVVFFAGSLLSRVIFSGLSVREAGINAVRETAFLGVVALFAMVLVVLIFSEPFRDSLAGLVIVPGLPLVFPNVLGFGLLFFSSMILVGMFPFHGNTKKIFEIKLIEKSIPLVLQSLFGFTLIFRFSAELFPREFREFSPFVLGFFSFWLAYCAFGFWGSRLARARVFWIQQAVNSLVVVGFFSLSVMGWHGAVSLIIFQSLSIPFLLIVLSIHERRPLFPVDRITEFPFFAFCTLFSILFALFLPISLGFYGLLLVIWSLMTLKYWFLVFLFISLTIFAFAGINSMFFFLGERPAEGSEHEAIFFDMNREELMAAFPLLFFLLVSGLAPKLIMGPTGASVAIIFQSIGFLN